MTVFGWVPFTRAWRRRRDEVLCRETADRVQEIVDGELPPTQAGAMLKRHLDACRRCQHEAEAIEQLKGAINRVGHEADPALVERLQAYAQRLCEEAREASEDERPQGRTE